MNIDRIRGDVSGGGETSLEGSHWLESTFVELRPAYR
jgi:hypothetical protein